MRCWYEAVTVHIHWWTLIFSEALCLLWLLFAHFASLQLEELVISALFIHLSPVIFTV